MGSRVWGLGFYCRVPVSDPWELPQEGRGAGRESASGTLDRLPKGTATPRGSKYPTSRVLGSKINTLNGLWSLKPYYLGTWTLWD